MDIDILHNEIEFTKLINSFMGDITKLAALRNTIVNNVEAKSKIPLRSSVKAEIFKILSVGKDKYITNKEIMVIKKTISFNSGWKQFKTSGDSGLTGDAVKAFQELDNSLRRIGIYMVRCGELERFHPEIISSDKPEWLHQVLKSEKIKNSEAHEYLKSITKYISDLQ